MYLLITVSIIATVVCAGSTPLYSPFVEGRIVGGANTTIEEYPYQLSLEYDGKHHCGASLIKPNIALTAAHCTNEVSAKHLRIRAGSTTREQDGELADVVSICQHPEFSTTTIDYDVAVLGLSRSFNLGVNIQTITLQPKNVQVPEGAVATVTGWGALRSGGPLATILQVVEVPRVSQDHCAKYYSLTSRMICFGYEEGEKDSCQSDSGGPLVVGGKQVGIVSFGIGCGLPDIPGVYAEVSNKNITNFINQCVSNL